MVARGVFLEAFRGVVIRIDGDAEHVPVRRATIHRLELLLGGFKTTAEARAEGRERASREDEGEGEGLAFEITEPDRSAQGVGEGVVRHLVADGERFHIAHATEGAGLGRQRGARSIDLLELIDPAVILGHQHAEGDRISRLQTGELFRVPDVEHHGHCFHVAGDVFVRDLHLLLLGQELLDQALDLVDLRVGSGDRAGRRVGGGGTAAFLSAGKSGERQKSGENESGY